MVLLTYNNTLIGAASVFDYRLRERHGGDVVDTTHVAELSFTVADGYQGRGLGSELLRRAAQAAADDGKTHIYTSFNPENDASRYIVGTVLGNESIVAGSRNLEDRFWRLPNVSPSDYVDIELAMQRFCGDIEQRQTEQEDETTPLSVAIGGIRRRARQLSRIPVHRFRLPSAPEVQAGE